jgi:hypothetical protein
MYTNIPQRELIQVFNNELQTNNTHKEQKQYNNPNKYDSKPKLHAAQQPPI